MRSRTELLDDLARVFMIAAFEELLRNKGCTLANGAAVQWEVAEVSPTSANDLSAGATLRTPTGAPNETTITPQIDAFDGSPAESLP